MGPTGYLPSSNDPDLGQKPLDEIREAFMLQAQGLIIGGVDALLIETSQDILEVKLAIEACHPLGLFYTGYSVADARLSLVARQRLSCVLGSACRLFVLRRVTVLPLS